nr:DUF6021 family protein [uncultured Pseudomonas sp.]
MAINPDAPGNFSQKGGDNHEDGVDDELGFDPDSPDLSDPQVDPPHPARTSNDPVRPGKGSVDE